MHIYTRELLEKHLLPELKEIALGLGISPDGNKTYRETWILALVGQPFPLFQSIDLPAENSPAAGTDRPQEPTAEIFSGEGPPNRGDGKGRIEPSVGSIDAIENSPAAGADRPQEPIDTGEFPDIESALAEIARLRAKNRELLELVRSQSETVRRAKNISPVQKPSFLRVLRLARSACLDLTKTPSGWLLSMGKNLTRKFFKLKEVWELLTQEDWHLTEVFGVLDPETSALKSKSIFPHRPWSKFITIPFCSDGLIDSDALGYAAGGGRAPPDEAVPFLW